MALWSRSQKKSIGPVRLCDCLWIVMWNVLQWHFLCSKVFEGFSTSVKQGYTCDQPTCCWKQNINLRKIYCSLEYGTEQLVSKRLVGMKILTAFLGANTKAMDLTFMAPIAYSVLFRVPLQDSTVSGELPWQVNKLLCHLAKKKSQ